MYGEQVPAQGNPYGPSRGGTRFRTREIQVLRRDVRLIQALAATLRGSEEKAEALRSALAKALTHPEVKTAFDIFGSELPEEAFAGVFEQPRQRNWREVDL